MKPLDESTLPDFLQQHCILSPGECISTRLLCALFYSWAKKAGYERHRHIEMRILLDREGYRISPGGPWGVSEVFGLTLNAEQTDRIQRVYDFANGCQRVAYARVSVADLHKAYFSDLDGRGIDFPWVPRSLFGPLLTEQGLTVGRGPTGATCVYTLLPTQTSSVMTVGQFIQTRCMYHAWAKMSLSELYEEFRKQADLTKPAFQAGLRALGYPTVAGYANQRKVPGLLLRPASGTPARGAIAW